MSEPLQVFSFLKNVEKVCSMLNAVPEIEVTIEVQERKEEPSEEVREKFTSISEAEKFIREKFKPSGRRYLERLYVHAYCSGSNPTQKFAIPRDLGEKINEIITVRGEGNVIVFINGKRVDFTDKAHLDCIFDYYRRGFGKFASKRLDKYCELILGGTV